MCSPGRSVAPDLRRGGLDCRLAAMLTTRPMLRDADTLLATTPSPLPPPSPAPNLPPQESIVLEIHLARPGLLFARSPIPDSFRFEGLWDHVQRHPRELSHIAKNKTEPLQDSPLFCVIFFRQPARLLGSLSSWFKAPNLLFPPGPPNLVVEPPVSSFMSIGVQRTRACSSG